MGNSYTPDIHSGYFPYTTVYTCYKHVILKCITVLNRCEHTLCIVSSCTGCTHVYPCSRHLWISYVLQLNTYDMHHCITLPFHCVLHTTITKLIYSACTYESLLKSHDHSCLSIFGQLALLFQRLSTPTSYNTYIPDRKRPNCQFVNTRIIYILFVFKESAESPCRDGVTCS